MRRSIYYAVCIVLGQALSGLSFGFDYNGTPAGWAIGLSESSETIDLRIGQGWRPTSIDATSPGSTSSRFVTGYVQNSGSHEKTIIIARNVSSTTINSYRSSGWRIEDVERTGSASYTALFTKSAENPVPTGWFANLTTSQVTSLLGSSRRLLELDSVVISGVRKFNGVWVSNSGTNAKAWGWMPDHTLQQIMDWARQNNMRITDLDPRGSGKYAAVFVRRKLGERYYVAAGTWSQIAEMQESTGTRIQVANRLEGQNFYAAVLVNNANSQVSRIADTLMSTAGRGRIGAYVKEINGPVLVDLRGSRDFYPCSAIKVLIHAAGLAKVPVDQLNTYKVDDSYLSYVATRMMVESHNPSTYTLNSHWGTDYINQYGRDNLGTTAMTWIEDHYGNPPPDSNWNAHATLKDMTNIYAKRSVLGSARVAKFRAWMYSDANSGLYDSLSLSLKSSLGLTTTQYNAWKSYLRFEFKAGNIWLDSGNTKHLHWVNVGRVTLPFRGGSFTVLRSYAFGHFVNDSIDGYSNSLPWSHSAGLVREQMIASMNSFK